MDDCSVYLNILLIRYKTIERERESARAQAGYIYTQESVARVDRYIHKAYYQTLQEYNGGVMSLLQ